MVDYFGNEVLIGDFANVLNVDGRLASNTKVRICDKINSNVCVITFVVGDYNSSNVCFRSEWLAVLPSSILARGE